MFVSAVLFPVFLAMSIAIEEGAPMIVPFFLFFVSIVWMVYARLFRDKNSPATFQAAARTSALRSTAAPGALPPATNMPMPEAGRHQVRTNELAQPPSVTENTTRLLDNE